jgi:hypothetical protein
MLYRQTASLAPLGEPPPRRKMIGAEGDGVGKIQ